MIYKVMGPAATDLMNNLDLLVKTNMDNGNMISASLTTMTNETITIMITLIVVIMAVSILLGAFISRIISRPVSKLVAAAEKIAGGDLNVSIDSNTRDEIGILGDAFRRMSDNINEVMSNINAAAEQVSAGAKQTSESSMALSQGATEQASSIEQLTASLEEISSQTRLNADNANQAKIWPKLHVKMPHKATAK